MQTISGLTFVKNVSLKSKFDGILFSISSVSKSFTLNG